MMPEVQEVRHFSSLHQNKQASVRCLINSIVSDFHEFSIDKCMVCLQMPLLCSDCKKTFMFESIKIGEESIKLIGYKR